MTTPKEQRRETSSAKTTDKDEVHAVGVQVGVTHVPWNALLNLHYFYEIESKDRFQGQSFGLNFAIKL